MVNPTKVTAVTVLSTSRNIIQIHQTLVIVTAVLYTAQSLTQLHQTGQKESPLKARLHPHSGRLVLEEEKAGKEVLRRLVENLVVTL